MRKTRLNYIDIGFKEREKKKTIFNFFVDLFTDLFALFLLLFPPPLRSKKEVDCSTRLNTLLIIGLYTRLLPTLVKKNVSLLVH